MKPESMSRKELIAEVKRLRLLPAHVGALIKRERKKIDAEMAKHLASLPVSRGRKREIEMELDDLRSRAGALWEFGYEFRRMSRRMSARAKFGI